MESGGDDANSVFHEDMKFFKSVTFKSITFENYKSFVPAEVQNHFHWDYQLS